MKTSVIFILLLFTTRLLSAQYLTDSNLPIVVINTDINPNTGQPLPIPDEPKVPASMKIIKRPGGARNFISDQYDAAYLNYSGRIGIEMRGSSSQTLPKKPYGFKTYNDDKITENNVSLLGMPEEHDWILNSIAFDPSLIRNYLSYQLVRKMGNYAPRCEFCEVVVNGDYKGLYIMMEKLKADDNRINIAKIEATDNSWPQVTGGYIIKADKITGGDPVGWTMPSYIGSTNYLYDNPERNDITTSQINYIQAQFFNLQKVATVHDASVISGFPSIIDIPSFVDYMLINELTSNADAYQYSTYFHKDRYGKLRAGPVWDLDLTFGNDIFAWGFDRSHTNVWQYDNGSNTGSKFWKDLAINTTFKCYLSKRWNQLTAPGKPFDYLAISRDIDNLVTLVAEAKNRENARWGTIPDQKREIEKMKNWIISRINWLSSNFGSFGSCTNPVLPTLAISKINYHPGVSVELESSDYEFIAITNYGTLQASLTGVYLTELGIGYQFPAGSTIAAGKTIFLCGNSQKFEQQYGFAPFGNYTRELSNNTEKIVLADAFGNIIDSVRYTDSLPWPQEADGKGFYLELSDLKSDNSRGENWVAASMLNVNVSQPIASDLLQVYPNPVTSVLNVKSHGKTIQSIEIEDLTGRKVYETRDCYHSECTMNIENFTSGIYLLEINFTDGSATVRKIYRR